MCSLLSVCASPFTGSPFPAVALLVFGALGVLAILMLVAILQQEKYVASIPSLSETKALNDTTTTAANADTQSWGV